ncbi:MAG: ATP-binding protein, partial [Actinoallomurus sp.]
MTSFIGRRRELAAVKRLLSRGRLVTLTGVGGVGKTRLAIRVAGQIRRAFPDGVWLVDLAPAEARGSPARLVAEVLGCRGRPDPATLAEYVRDKRLLLVLDNCEHLLPQCATLADRLLRSAPWVRILATSRQPLGVAGEHIQVVPPLPVPEAVDGPDEQVAACDAVRLFAERASAVLPDSTIDTENGAAVARLCRRLDGIPLAIELAAERMPALPVQEIEARLDDRFELLGRQRPAAAPRQQTLRAAIDRSYDLCSPQEQALWGRLSVFSGGCGLEAIEQICSGTDLPKDRMLDITAGLVDKSILHPDTRSAQMRYHLLETLRLYGR